MTQKRGTVTAIEPFFALFDETLSVFLLRLPVPGTRVMFEPVLLLFAPFLEESLWDRIGEAKRDEVGGAGLDKVREVSATLLDLAPGIEAAEKE